MNDENDLNVIIEKYKKNVKNIKEVAKFSQLPLTSRIGIVCIALSIIDIVILAIGLKFAFFGIASNYSIVMICMLILLICVIIVCVKKIRNEANEKIYNNLYYEYRSQRFKILLYTFLDNNYLLEVDGIERLLDFAERKKEKDDLWEKVKKRMNEPRIKILKTIFTLIIGYAVGIDIMIMIIAIMILMILLLFYNEFKTLIHRRVRYLDRLIEDLTELKMVLEKIE